VALYALLRQDLGLGGQAANLAALGVTAVANTAANRRLTFGTAGGRGAGREQFRGLPVFLLLRSFVFQSRRRPPT
jgi:hypothetical protein